jgi:AcrR family transcriptional regulator
MQDGHNGGSGVMLRRMPKQERSRDRIDEILKVSMDLIGQKGIDAVTMKEIASLSGGPIASVYQYFPNKSAIIATLHERYIEEVRQLVAEHVSTVESVDDAIDMTDKLFDIYYELMRAKPATQDLLNAVQADKALADRDVSEIRFQANVIYEGTMRFVREQLRESYRSTLFLMSSMAAATLRLALMVPADEARTIVAQFKSVVRVQATYFFTGSYPQQTV